MLVDDTHVHKKEEDHMLLLECAPLRVEQQNGTTTNSEARNSKGVFNPAIGKPQ